MRRNNVIAVVLTAVFLLVGMFGTGLENVKAASGTKLVISSVTGGEGDTVKVDVSVAENAGMCGMTIGVKYDKTVLTVVEAVCAEDVFSVSDAIINTDGDGVVSYIYGGLKDKTSTGKLMTITFKINEGAKLGDSAIVIGNFTGADGNVIEIEASNFNGDTVTLSSEAGKVTVVCKHAQTKENVTKKATCTDAGEKAVVCVKCNETVKTETIAATGHKYGEYAVTKEATCTEAGEKTAECSVCKDKKTETVAVAGHKYGEYVVTKEATCTEAGEKTAECSVCKDKKTEAVAATGHSFGEYVVDKEATVLEAGAETAKCANCDVTDTREIPKLKGNDSAATGDTAPLMYLMVMLVISGTTLLTVSKKRKNA